jgi:hypothetical protein
MLTAALIRPRIAQKEGQVWTRPLPVADPHWLHVAEELLAIFAAHVSRKRGQLDQALRDYEADSLDYPIIRGLAKTIADNCQFEAQPPVDPPTLRERLFRLAARRGPVVRETDLVYHTTRETLVAQIATELCLAPATVDEALYADLAEEQVLCAVPDWSPRQLLERYNLELARGLLYWASELRLRVYSHYKDIFKYIKLFKLMHEVFPLPDGGYHIRLDGPISPFVRSTTRYGFQFAKFLPALLLSDGWQMEADIHLATGSKQRQASEQPLLYRLDNRSGLISHYTASGDFDSRLEADFAREFEEKYCRVDRTWKLAREDEIIPVGDTVMIPDFSFTHVRDGRRALLEIAGFWHPDYIRRKIRKLRQAGRHDLIVLVYEGVNCSGERWEDVPGEVIKFVNKPVLKEVLAAVERVAVKPARNLREAFSTA